MSKFTKKVLALLLAVMMLMSLAACGGKAEKTPAEEAPVEETPAAEAESSVSKEAPSQEEAIKKLTITVVHGDGSSKELEVSTEAENLREALEPEGIIAGDESEFGLFIKTVDGETADDSKQQWWAVTKGGEMAETGVDSIIIADGESYEFTLITGW